VCCLQPVTWASRPREVLIKSGMTPFYKSSGLSERGAAAPGALQPLAATRGWLPRALSPGWAGGKGLRRPPAPAQFTPAHIPALGKRRGSRSPQPHVPPWANPPAPRPFAAAPAMGGCGWPLARPPASWLPGFLLFFRAAALPATGRSRRRAAGGPRWGQALRGTLRRGTTAGS